MTLTSYENLLSIEGLYVWFYTYQGIVRAVEDAALYIKKGEIVGLVGETGCGKSVTSLSILRLVKHPGKIERGRVFFRGEDLLQKSEKELRKIRGKEIAMIFQKPMDSLNPVFRIERQFLEILQLHQRLSRQAAKQKMLESLEAVGLPDVESISRIYPHELSGGMQQRVMIALALACNSRLLIADEPTSALDVSTQLQFLKVLRRIQQKTGMSVLLISHDIGVIASICSRVYVMYAGIAVEGGSTKTIIHKPSHPYARGLIKSVPVLGGKRTQLSVIRGDVPSLLTLPRGCRFYDRCDMALEICPEVMPEPIELEKEHFIRCHWVEQMVGSL